MIDWGDILETEDHRAALEKMYETETLEQLSERLGVSLNALREKMMKEDIPFKPRGGIQSHIGKSRLDSLPIDILEKTPVRHLAKLFGMHKSAVYKYLRKRGIKRETDTREAPEAEESGMSCEGSLGSSEVEVQSEVEDDSVSNGCKPGTTGEVRGSVQASDD